MVEIYIHVHNCFLRGLTLEQIQLLDNVLSYSVEGAAFSTAYQRGFWDGRKRLFNKKCLSFKLGLLYRVIKWLETEKIEWSISDYQYIFEENPQIEQILEEGVYNEIQLKSYQKEAIKKYCKIRKYGETEFNLFRGILSMPPRSGKTLTAGVLGKVLNLYPILFVVNRIDLALQTQEEFEKVFKQKIGIIGDGNYDAGANIVISTIQSICMAYDIKEKFDEKEKDIGHYEEFKELISNVKVCFIDECHTSGAEIFQELPLILENVQHIIGLTGTAYRDDGADLLVEQLCGPVIYNLSRDEAVAQGCILSIKAIFVKLPALNIFSKDWQSQKKQGINENAYLLDGVKKLIGQLEAKNLSTVIIVKEKLQGDRIHKLLGCKYLHSGVRGKDRKMVYDQLNKKEILTIVSTVTDIGVNIPTLDAVLIAAPSKSKVAAFQRIRCGTPFKGKKKGFLIVMCASVNASKDYLTEHWNAMLKIYKKEKTFEIVETNYNNL